MKRALMIKERRGRAATGAVGSQERRGPPWCQSSGEERDLEKRGPRVLIGFL